MFGTFGVVVKNKASLFLLTLLLIDIFTGQIKHSFFGKNNLGNLSCSLFGFKEVSPLLKKKEYELFIGNIYLGNQSRIRDKDNVFLRLTLDENNVFDIGRHQNWSMKRGQQIKINQKFSVDPQFFQSNKVQFSVELMSEESIWNMGKAEISILRCRTNFQDLREGSRSFECSVPGEVDPVISYGLIQKNAPLQDSNINKIASY